MILLGRNMPLNLLIICDVIFVASGDGNKSFHYILTSTGCLYTTCSHDPTTGPHPEPYDFSAAPNAIPKINFNIFLYAQSQHLRHDRPNTNILLNTLLSDVAGVVQSL
jgi:hypothetical protein